METSERWDREHIWAFLSALTPPSTELTPGTKIQEIWGKKKLFFDGLASHCDRDLEDLTFLHDTPGHDDAASYQVWLQTV